MQYIWGEGPFIKEELLNHAIEWVCKELLLPKDFWRDLGKTKTEYVDRGASEEIKPDC